LHPLAYEKNQTNVTQQGLLLEQIISED